MAKRGPKPKKLAQAAEEWPGFELPADLDPVAAREFARLARRLAELGVAAKTDPRLVVVAARTHALLENAHAVLASEGITLKACNGTPMPHPVLASVNSLTLRLKTLWAEMGLTPKSSNLTAPRQAKTGPGAWDGLLNVIG